MDEPGTKVVLFVGIAKGFVRFHACGDTESLENESMRQTARPGEQIYDCTTFYSFPDTHLLSTSTRMYAFFVSIVTMKSGNTYFVEPPND